MIEEKTISSFGDEWCRFDQSNLSLEELRVIFDDYFAIFPWDALPVAAEGFDMGCGSGRWARFIASRVGKLNCIDPSKALKIAQINLCQFSNVDFIEGSFEAPGIASGSQDFGYCLGVLHHVVDTNKALRSCVNLLKPGAPLLIYIYYDLDDRPNWYKCIWYCSNLLRLGISALPPHFKNFVTNLIAITVYWPLSRLCKLIEFFGYSSSFIPLFYYRNSSLYTMRTDSRDRFGTPLEKRFSKAEIADLMIGSGLVNIKFSDKPPYWCAVGFKDF